MRPDKAHNALWIYSVICGSEIFFYFENTRYLFLSLQMPHATQRLIENQLWEHQRVGIFPTFASLSLHCSKLYVFNCMQCVRCTCSGLGRKWHRHELMLWCILLSERRSMRKKQLNSRNCPGSTSTISNIPIEWMSMNVACNCLRQSMKSCY